jgi:hypothetical protein
MNQKCHLLVGIASLMSLSLCLGAQSVTLAWDASSDTSIAGYKLRYGTSSGNPSQTIDVGKTTTQTVSNLNDATTYFFTVTAYNTAALESQPSNEISYTTPASGSASSSAPTPTPTPTPGVINIGETTVLSTADNGNGNLLVAQQATLSVTSVLQSMSFYVTNAAGTLRLGVYDASGPGGGPGNKVAETAEISPVSGWNRATTSPTVLPAGTYWLAYFPSSDSLAFVKNPNGTGGRTYPLPYGPLPSTFSTTPSSTQSNWSFYATLQP